MESEAGVAFSPPKNANGNVEQESRPSYSIPGILHFIQHEWTRFEMERAHWEIERAELQVRSSLYYGYGCFFFHMIITVGNVSDAVHCHAK